MKNNETPEMLLDRVSRSVKIRKLAVILALAGIIICIIALLPIVRNTLFSFVDTRTSGINMRTSNTFDSRLTSLLSLVFFGLVFFVFSLCCLFSKPVSSFLENAKNTRLIAAAASVTGVLLLGYISVLSYKYGWRWLNSDHSSEMVLGKLLADENVFASTSWRYSTEIRLVYQTIFTMPLFKILGNTDNWALIRSINILLNNIVLVLSYLFMARQIKIRTKWICVTSLFLIMPVSGIYWDIVTFGGFYIFFIAQIFCCLGLFIKLAVHTGTVKTALADFILFTALSFLLGLQGIRSPICVHIPLLVTCIYLYSKAVRKRILPLFLGCYGFIAGCIGFAGNYLLHFKYSFYSFDIMKMENLFENFLLKFGESLVSLPVFFGISEESQLLSARGLFGIISLIGTVILFREVFKSVRQKNNNETVTKPDEYQYIPVFFIVSVMINIFVFIIINEKITARYFIPFMVLYVPLIAILFEYAEKSYGHLKRIAVVSGIVLFICGQSYLNFKNMAVRDRDVNSVRKGYIRYLLDSKLDYGFATYWNANITTELSNGKIKLAGLDPKGLETGKDDLRLQGWLNPKKFYEPSYHQGESFLLLTRVELELARETGRPFALLQPDYEDGSFIIIRYPSAGIIHTEVLDN
jgi:hypothetical protein